MLVDFRYTMRLMAKSLALTAVAIITLALGIGANTAISAWSMRSLLAPLGYETPDLLVSIWSTNPKAEIKQEALGGDGWGRRSFSRAGRRGSKPTVTTIKGSLLFQADATYSCKLNTKAGQSDEVIANGISIKGAEFNLVPYRNRKLQTGQVFVVISNTATTPINGTFANLADGSTLTVGNNTFEANYEGGDGNDLTLTVVP
jgi:hypothetical protein